MDEYPQVETCIECSALELKNISELFYYAQKAVLHPTAPLFSHDEQRLTEKCEIGLQRIFRICDMDNDGVLSDIELNEFQKRCFQNSLPTHGLQEVKNIIQRNMEDGVNEEGVTLQGFLFLHSLFIQKGRQETTWTALRRFGYDHNLELRDDYLVPSLQKGSDCSVELSATGVDFVMDLYLKHDANADDALDPEELTDMISICEEHPWTDIDFTATCSTEEGWMTAEGFVAQWILWTFIDYSWTLKHLAQFGFINSDLDNQLSGLVVKRSKSIDRQKKKTTRAVFLVYIVGAPEAGKTAFLQSYINKKYDGDKVYSEYTINSVQIGKKEIYLILKEIPYDEAKDQLLESKHDATVYLYDTSNPASFAPVADLHNQVDSQSIPSMFIGTKSDLTSVRQECNIQPNEFAVIHSAYPLQYYTSMSERDVKLKSVFTKIATLCTHVGYSSVTDVSFPKLALSYGIGLSVVLGVGFLVFRFVRQSRNVVASS
jgi:Ras family protein T1